MGEAARAFAEAVDEARCAPESVRQPQSFLRRFVGPSEAAALLTERCASLCEARDWRDIPAAIWPLYEVVGAELVGIPCRCAMDTSLNAKGLCSGIIGRPLQAIVSGCADEQAMLA